MLPAIWRLARSVTRLASAKAVDASMGASQSGFQGGATPVDASRISLLAKPDPLLAKQRVELSRVNAAVLTGP